MTTIAQAPVELVPCGRFEWERIVKRVDPGVLPMERKGFALLLATWADSDGSRVRPGSPRLCATTGKSDKTIRRWTAQLVELGLLLKVRRGGGRGGSGSTTDWQLAIPVDLLDRVPLLEPDEQPAHRPVTQMTAQLPGGTAILSVALDVSPVTQVTARRESTGHDKIATVPDRPVTLVTVQSARSPVDNSESPVTQVTGETIHTPVDDVDRPVTQVTGENGAPNGLTGHLARLTGHPGDRLPTTRPTTRDPGLSTATNVKSARGTKTGKSDPRSSRSANTPPPGRPIGIDPPPVAVLTATTAAAAVDAWLDTSEHDSGARMARCECGWNSPWSLPEDAELAALEHAETHHVAPSEPMP